MQETFLNAETHRGASFIEVLQNCVIFNDKIHDAVTNRKTKAETTLVLKDGQPMLFGAENEKGIVLEGLTPKVVTLGENGITEKDILVHDVKDPTGMIAHMLASFKYPEFPVPIGVFRAVEAPVYTNQLQSQVDEVKKSKPDFNMEKLLHSGSTWVVE